VIATHLAALAAPGGWPYLNYKETAIGAAGCKSPFVQNLAMAPPFSTPHELATSFRLARKLPAVMMVAGAALAAALFLGALGLWFQYGTAVFFEMIASGFAAWF
jgi:hypothetical protein